MDADSDGPPLNAARIIEVLDRNERNNLDRLGAALRELRAYLRVGGLDDETARALPVMIDAAMLERVETSTWRTEAGDVDVPTAMRVSGGARLAFDDIEGRATEIAVVGIGPARQPARHH